MTEFLKQQQIRYTITSTGLHWKKAYSNISYWRDDISTCLHYMKIPTKAFMLAMLLQNLLNDSNNINFKNIFLRACLVQLNHLGGCLYKTRDQSSYQLAEILQEKLDQLNLDIKIECKSCYGKAVIGFILGKRYTAEYRRRLITSWKLEGKI